MHLGDQHHSEKSNWQDIVLIWNEAEVNRSNSNKEQKIVGVLLSVCVFLFNCQKCE